MNKDGSFWQETFPENAKDIFFIKDCVKKEDKTYNKSATYNKTQQPILIRVLK